MQAKRAIINVKNNDNQCFKYAVLSALFCDKITHPQRASSYKNLQHTYDFSGLTYPVDLKQIHKFEQKNVTISLNVYMFDSKAEKVRPLCLTTDVKEHHIHLLMLTEEVNGETKSHFSWIKNLSGLFSSQLTKNGHKRFFCDRRLNSFVTEAKLNQHLIYCTNQNECQVQMPSFNNNIIEFKNRKNQLPVPFIIYADIESILKPVDSTISSGNSTSAYQHHEAHSVGYHFKCSFDDTNVSNCN